MKTAGILSAVVLVITLVTNSYALSCYKCDGSNYDGEKDNIGYCFNLSTFNNNCSTSTGYCETSFVIEDGVTTEIRRECRYGDMPEGGWSTENNYSYGTTSKSTFYKYCNSTDVCNKDQASGLIPCTVECKNGVCDYILGLCACYSGYQGDTCEDEIQSLATGRKCHQCSTEYDGDSCGVEQSGAGDNCPSGEYNCSTSKTTVFDADGFTIVKTVTTRACTREDIKSGCEFTDIHYDSPFDIHPYKEYTCYTTCDSDSCNNGNSDDAATDESSDMYCVQCSDTSDCEQERSLCPRGTNFCSSKVVYTIAERTGRHKEEHPHYDLISVDRGCATESVPRQCTEEQLAGASSIKKVTCSETCEQDGCNTGWPARPKCVDCSGSGTDTHCIEDPPFPKSCDFPYQSYCYIRDEGIKKGTTDATSGYPRIMTRGCSHYDLGTSCTSSTLRETEIESCNRTCTTDGCNVGSGGEIPLQTLLFVLLVALSTILL